MQQRNLIWFCVLSFLILLSWTWVQTKIWPPKPKTAEDKSAETVDWAGFLVKYHPLARATNLVASRGLSTGGIFDEIRLGQDLLFTPPLPRRVARWEDLPEAVQKIALAVPPPLPGALSGLALWSPSKSSAPVAEEIPFGGEKYHLQGSFTTRGAGVQKLTLNSELLELKPGKKIAHQFLLYHGPVKTMLLGQYSGDKQVDPRLVERYTYKLHLNTLTDYGRFLFWTDLLVTVTKWMHGLLYYLHFLCFGSYGLTIILLTVLVRGLMFPISKKQANFSVRMQAIAPEVKKIKEKYPNDRQAQTQATMELYRKHGVSPLGSCLPLLMQMPIFLGLYYALQESIHFRLAEFLWIKNLAAPDMLLWWTEKIPWVSDPDNLGRMLYLGPFLNLLPLFAVTLMIAQQKMMTPPAMDEQQEMQQKMMKYMMAFFGILFYKVASGLCIYFISSSLWGLAERYLLPKKAAAGAAAVPSTPAQFHKIRGKGPFPGEKPEESNGLVSKLKDWWTDLLERAQKK